jgi:hypothetical protein
MAMATVSIILSGAFSSAAVTSLAVSLAKRQIANQALVLHHRLLLCSPEAANS